MDHLLVARSLGSEYVGVHFWNNFDLFHGAVQCPVQTILEWPFALRRPAPLVLEACALFAECSDARYGIGFGRFVFGGLRGSSSLMPRFLF